MKARGVVGIDTGMAGALVELRGGLPWRAALLDRGEREPGWTSLSPVEVHRLDRQLYDFMNTGAGWCAYEQIQTTRGIHASRSLFGMEALLLRTVHELRLPLFPVPQSALKRWVKVEVGGQWKGQASKEDMVGALPESARSLFEAVVASHFERPTFDALPKAKRARLEDLADAYWVGRYAIARIINPNLSST